MDLQARGKTDMTLKRRRTLIVSILALWLLASGNVDAHRMVLGYKVSEVQLNALYDDGTPAQGIKISAMKDGDVVFEGTTDAKGILFFRPDENLRDYSFVSSSVGHRAELNLVQDDEGSQSEVPLVVRVGAGLGYLLGLAGLSMFYVSRRRTSDYTADRIA